MYTNNYGILDEEYFFETRVIDPEWIFTTV